MGRNTGHISSFYITLINLMFETDVYDGVEKTQNTDACK